MREAYEDSIVTTENAVEYSKAIYNAETEEEVEAIKQEIVENLRQEGYDETFIQDWIQQIDMIVDKIESMDNENTIQGNLQTSTEQPVIINPETNTNASAGIAVGVVVVALAASIALKKKILKNKNNKSL